MSGTPAAEGFKNTTSQSVTLADAVEFCESSSFYPCPCLKARDEKRQGSETSTSVVHRTRTASMTIHTVGDCGDRPEFAG